MILYKYLRPERIDVLRNRRIRFTQPGDLNDPFEFRPKIVEAASDATVRSYVEENFDKLVDEEVAKYGALAQALPLSELKNLLHQQKELLPVIYRLLEPTALKQLSPVIEDILNASIGVLCLTEVNNSLLMWGHYTDSHRGFVIGFDSESPFFWQRKTEKDEFGFLRRVEYTVERPQVVLSDTSSGEWFQTKAKSWEYETEWRMIRVLAEADYRDNRTPFPVCLFDFPPEAVRQIIFGIRSDASLISEIQALACAFPNASVLAAREDAGFALAIENAAQQSKA